jgi:cytoskeletal protein RodZ
VKVETPRDFGDELRRERELREVTRAQLALVTKVSVRQIEALETGRFEVLPALVFSRGFVRAIALHLGLDPDRTVAAYRHVFETWEASRPKEAYSVPSVRPMTDTFPTQRPRRTVASSTTIRAVAVTATLAIATGIAILAKSRAPEPRRGAAPGPTRSESGPASLALPQSVAAATVALPAGAAVPGRTAASVTPPAPGGTSTMTLRFRDDCWAEVLVDGKVAARSLFPKGSTREFAGGRAFTLTLGNAGGVDVTIDGRPIPPVGRPGEVVKNFQIDPAAVRTSG